MILDHHKRETKWPLFWLKKTLFSLVYIYMYRVYMAIYTFIWWYIHVYKMRFRSLSIWSCCVTWLKDTATPALGDGLWQLFETKWESPIFRSKSFEKGIIITLSSNHKSVNTDPKDSLRSVTIKRSNLQSKHIQPTLPSHLALPHPISPACSPKRGASR